MSNRIGVKMVKSGEKIVFGEFRLDAAEARLVRRNGHGEATIALTPRSFDLLRYLAARPGQLVTKNELLKAVWNDAFVSDASIKVAVREVRKALGDDADTPKYIETIHRRGYRFIADVSSDASAAVAWSRKSAPPTPQVPFVGREEQLQRLIHAFARAASPQTIFITGSPGAGKTALIDELLRQLQSGGGTHLETAPPIVLLGHCFEQFAGSEPYMPVWEAVTRAVRQHDLPPFTALLSRHSADLSSPPPSATDFAADRQRVMAQRLLRDLADAIEALAATTPVVFVLEDAHWVDHSTLDLVSALARRSRSGRNHASLMLVITFRPAEVLADQHPLRDVVRELLAARLAEEMALESLDQQAVERYLQQRFPGAKFSPEFVERLHQRTSGHPLFLVHVIDDLVDESGALRSSIEEMESQVPPSVRALIESQLDQLSETEQRVLEAAAVAGHECSAAAVAAAMRNDDVAAVEQVCADLARRHRFLAAHDVSEWPDGTAASSYRFVHDLYHSVVYGRIGAARRAQLHAALGQRLERAWGSRAGEEAATLAMHFEQGRDWPRAVKHLRHAADIAARQYAHREAVGYLLRARRALDRLPPGERSADELQLLVSLGVHLQIVKGCAAPQVEEVFACAEALCKEADVTANVEKIFPVLWGIWVFHKVRSELPRAAELAKRLLALAQHADDQSLLMQAHQAMCVTSLCVGEPAVTVSHMDQAAAIYDPKLHAANTSRFGQDPGVATLSFGAIALWLTGRESEAAAASESALALARRHDQPSSLALALHFAAMLHQLRGDAAAVANIAQQALTLSDEEGFSFWHAGATIFNGWASAARGKREGIDGIRRGLQAWLDTGSRTYQPYYLGLLADGLRRHGHAADASQTLDDALAAARALPEGLYEAELLRMKAAASQDKGAAIRLLKESIAVATRQGATMFESRARADLKETATEYR
jgi:DNA-binding winged helix-turn-helix (wHTH) protein/predicted ATPase